MSLSTHTSASARPVAISSSSNTSHRPLAISRSSNTSPRPLVISRSFNTSATPRPLSFCGPNLSDFCSGTPPPFHHRHSSATTLCYSVKDEVPDPFRNYLPPRLREIFSQSFDPRKFSSSERLANFLRFSAKGNMKSPLEWMGDYHKVPNISTPVWVKVTIDGCGVVHLDGFCFLDDKLMAAVMVLKEGFDGHNFEEVGATYGGFFELLQLDLQEGDTFMFESFMVLLFIRQLVTFE